MFGRALERLLLFSRWLLAPFLVLLIGALCALLLKALQLTLASLHNLPQATEAQVIVDALGYVDLTLTALLIVIVVLSGYENFISRFSLERDERIPAWLTTIDFAGLKLKLLSTMVAISAIQLLREFMDVADVSNRDLGWSIGIHLTFVASGLVLALTDRLNGEPDRSQ